MSRLVASLVMLVSLAFAGTALATPVNYGVPVSGFGMTSTVGDYNSTTGQIGYFLPFISNTCHVGGLIAGFVLTFLWLAPGRPSALQWAWRLATASLLASLTFAALLPVTRHDWLDRAREAEIDPARKAALGRAQRLSD